MTITKTISKSKQFDVVVGALAHVDATMREIPAKIVQNDLIREIQKMKKNAPVPGEDAAGEIATRASPTMTVAAAVAPMCQRGWTRSSCS